MQLAKQYRVTKEKTKGTFLSELILPMHPNAITKTSVSEVRITTVDEFVTEFK